jgi:CRISPR-associated endoribonuclease Cas6
MDLLSLVLTLRPERAAPLPSRLGRAAHAILLQRLADVDAELATALHEADGRQPFTCSDLLGSRDPERRVSPEQPYTLRYTALTAPVAEALSQAFQPGDTLTFEGVPFTIQALTTDPDETPWAGADTYEVLAARYLVSGAERPRHTWPFLLTTPVAFQSQDVTEPLPRPTRFYQSLVQQWNTFAPVALPADEVVRYIEKLVVVSRFSIRSAIGWQRGRALRIGAIGTITFQALNRDRYWLAVLSLLGAYARYAGVGTLTTMGMGQVRLK